MANVSAKSADRNYKSAGISSLFSFFNNPGIERLKRVAFIRLRQNTLSRLQRDCGELHFTFKMRDQSKKGDRKKKLLEAKRQYLKLRYKIEMYELERDEPPAELVARARIVGRLAEIPEEELNCI